MGKELFKNQTMKLTREILLKDGWTHLPPQTGIFDSFTDEVFTYSEYNIRLGLFDCMGIISGTEAEPYVQFFAWFLTVGDYRHLAKALKIGIEANIYDSRFEKLK